MRRALFTVPLTACALLSTLVGPGCSSTEEPGGGDSGGGTGNVSGGAGLGTGGAVGGTSGGVSPSGGASGSAGATATGGGSGTGTGGGAGSTVGGSGGSATGGTSAGGSAGTSGGSDSGGTAGSAAGTAGSAAGTAGSGGGGNNALFSDGFEGTSVDMTKWTPRLNGNGMLAIDTNRKHTGNSSLRVSANNAYSTLLAKEGAPIFPAPNNQYFGRVWFYVPAPLPADHVIWLESGVVQNDQHEVRIGMHLGYGQINLWQNGEVDIREPSAPMRPDAWICLEFRMANDVLEVWMDGNRVDGLSTTNWVAANQQNGNQTPKSNWSPMHAAFRLGWELNAGTREIWYDDVALGHARIGCN
ncbi:MAG TPA: hypothetical protein VFZ53_16205 [Polyangiaceae bacterium]